MSSLWVNVEAQDGEDPQISEFSIHINPHRHESWPTVNRPVHKSIVLAREVLTWSSSKLEIPSCTCRHWTVDSGNALFGETFFDFEAS